MDVGFGNGICERSSGGAGGVLDGDIEEIGTAANFDGRRNFEVVDALIACGKVEALKDRSEKFRTENLLSRRFYFSLVKIRVGANLEVGVKIRVGVNLNGGGGARETGVEVV